MDLATATRRLAAHGQQSVLRFWGSLDDGGRARLLAQVESLDLDWLERVFAAEWRAVDPRHIAPPGDVVREGHGQERDAISLGEEALRLGRVGTLLVAGGQGTRLGFDGPKGEFPVGAVSGRTLYRIHGERLLALGRRCGRTPPLYLMTSDANHEAALELFAREACFGLPPDRVRIFQQGLAPAVDDSGTLLLDAPDHVAMAPNGNGGLFAALRDSGAFEHMRSIGVDTISYIQVDNPLSLSCDPRFVGHHLLRQSQFSCKAIRKTSPFERVGSYARVNGRLQVVEYTEIPAELAQRIDDQGELLLSFSNPGLFVWSREFAEAQAARRDLPFHKAHKKIPHLDAGGQLLFPAEPSGYKFEAFAMDTLPDAERSLLLACDRDAEFAPVKNAAGDDSPASARALMTKLYTSWIVRAGGRMVSPGAAIEVSPLYALDAEELQAKLPRGFEVTSDLYLGPGPRQT